MLCSVGAYRIGTYTCMPYVYNSSQDVEKCALDLVSSSSTRTNTIKTIALASKGGQKFLQDPLLWVSADDNIGVTVEGERWSSAVDSAVELACTGLAHKARAALSGLSGRRHGRWCRVRAPSSGRRSGPSELFQPYVTQMYILLMQHAVCA